MERNPEKTTRKIVLPGDFLGDLGTRKTGKNIYVSGGKAYSTKVGLLEEKPDYVSVIPLKGAYVPNTGDLVIGFVQSEVFGGYVVDINTPVMTFIPKDQVRFDLRKGQILFAKITHVDELNEADINLVRVLPRDGVVITVDPVKTPRLLGKNNSMLELLRKTTEQIFIGRNGRVFLRGEDLETAIEVIRFISEHSHKPNLTEKVSEMIDKKLKLREKRLKESD